MALLNFILQQPAPPNPPDRSPTGRQGLLKALLDAIYGEDNNLGGQAFTRLTAPLVAGGIAFMEVESSIDFGEDNDGLADGRFLIGNEIITATGRTDTSFTNLTRAVDATVDKTHPIGTIVLDFARNSSVLDLIWRGFLVNYAVGADLDVVGRNLGVVKCIGMDDATWREVIRTVAYLPKTTVDAFAQSLTALYGAGNFEVWPDLVNPYRMRVFVPSPLDSGDNSLRGRFLLNGGEKQDTTDALEVDATYPISQVLGVYDDTPLARMGVRDGLTNYATTNTFAGSTITLDASPGAAGTSVIVDYGAFQAHFLGTKGDQLIEGIAGLYFPEAGVQPVDDPPEPETLVEPAARRPFLIDPTAQARCLLEQIRGAGIGIDFFVT
jgi:hypothetical protein